MQDFTTTEDGSWTFTFGGEKPKLPERPNMATGYLEGPGKWENYSDDTLYECESLLRQFLESKRHSSHWTQQNPIYRRYTVGMMHEVLFGEKYDSKDKEHQVRGRRLAKLMTYYSTRKQKEGSIRGKKCTKTIYTLSIRRYMRIPPYSLRLRLEWLKEQGRMPCGQNMQLPKDNLEAGHARNKRTDANMERRREQARAKYNERYKHRPH